MVSRHKLETRRLIRDIIHGHLGNVKIQHPVRNRLKGRIDFTGHELDALQARAEAWLAARGLESAQVEREPEHVLESAPHRARIVHSVLNTPGGKGAPRRVSTVLSHTTGRVLGEQG